MSDKEKMIDQPEVPKLNLFDQLKIQHAQFIQQRDIAQTNLNQLIGAIFACEIMIKNHEIENAEKGLSQKNLGEHADGKTDNQAKKQVA